MSNDPNLSSGEIVPIQGDSDGTFSGIKMDSDLVSALGQLMDDSIESMKHVTRPVDGIGFSPEFQAQIRALHDEGKTEEAQRLILDWIVKNER